jgi:hypothetical protein
MRDVAARSPLALTAHPACRLCLARGPWGISGPIPDPTRTQCIEGGLRCAPPRRPQVTPASTRAAHTWLEQPPPLTLSDSAPGWWWSVVSMQPGPRRAGGARASDRTPDPSSQWHRACVALQGINPRGHWLGGRHLRPSLVCSFYLEPEVSDDTALPSGITCPPRRGPDSRRRPRLNSRELYRSPTSKRPWLKRGVAPHSLEALAKSIAPELSPGRCRLTRRLRLRHWHSFADAVQRRWPFIPG